MYIRRCIMPDCKNTVKVRDISEFKACDVCNKTRNKNIILRVKNNLIQELKK